MDFSTVAPLAGAWIEINMITLGRTSPAQSLPSRERGLKWYCCSELKEGGNVAPLAGAWIEIEQLTTDDG